MYGEALPDIPESEPLLDYWRELGCVRMLPMGGYAGLEWAELSAFITATQCDLSPIEALTLIEMSRAFASGINDTAPLSVSPMERQS